MIKKLYSNLINSLNGLKIVSKENSFILELVLGVFLIPYIFLSNIDLNYKIILSVLYFLLLAFEIMNTAVEKLCDRVTTDLDPEIKKIKDLSSAAVFIVLLILKYKNISLLSMYLMFPYLLWCCFALFLNINIYLIN